MGFREKVRVQGSANAVPLQVEAQPADEFLLCGILDLLAEVQPDFFVVHLVSRSTQRLRIMLQVKMAISNYEQAGLIVELASRVGNLCRHNSWTLSWSWSPSMGRSLKMQSSVARGSSRTYGRAVRGTKKGPRAVRGPVAAVCRLHSAYAY